MTVQTSTLFSVLVIGRIKAAFLLFLGHCKARLAVKHQSEITEPLTKKRKSSITTLGRYTNSLQSETDTIENHVNSRTKAIANAVSPSKILQLHNSFQSKPI